MITPVPTSFLVIGGAGRTGRRIVDRLAAAGHRAVVASRRPAARGHDTAVVDLARPVDPAVLEGIAGVAVSVEPPSDTAGAEAVLHRGLAAFAALAAGAGVPVVLVSQIYVTRAAEHPEMAGIIRARAAGEDALRASGAPYAIVRPSWLTDGPAGGVRLEQGDTGDGTISRDAVAAATVAALTDPGALGRTVELYDDAHAPVPDWPAALAALAPDTAR